MGMNQLTPIELIRRDELTKTESVASFMYRGLASDWKLARENLNRSVRLQANYYDKKHGDVGYNVGDLVLLSTHNLKLKGTPEKLQKRFRGAFSGDSRPLESRPIGYPYLMNGKYTLCSMSLC